MFVFLSLVYFLLRDELHFYLVSCKGHDISLQLHNTKLCIYNIHLCPFIVNTTSINIYVQVSLLFVDLESFRYIFKHDIDFITSFSGFRGTSVVISIFADLS